MSRKIALTIMLTLMLVSIVSAEEVRRELEGKTFILNNETWVDIEYDGENITEVKIGSREYSGIPELEKYRKVGDSYIIKLGEKSYLVEMPEQLAPTDYLRIYVSILIVILSLVITVIGIRKYSSSN